MAVDRWSSEEMGEHARVRTGVEVADDDAFAEPRLGPEGAGPHPEIWSSCAYLKFTKLFL